MTPPLNVGLFESEYSCDLRHPNSTSYPSEPSSSSSWIAFAPTWSFSMCRFGEMRPFRSSCWAVLLESARLKWMESNRDIELMEHKISNLDCVCLFKGIPVILHNFDMEISQASLERPCLAAQYSVCERMTC